MTARLIENLATTAAYEAVFSDDSLLQAMLDFEAALARAEAAAGVIPREAADFISRAARSSNFDAAQIGKDGLRAGTLVIPLVKALTEKVRAADSASARFVHWGATSQDASDTAIVLLLRRMWELLRNDHARILAGLRLISDQHASAVMLGRTLLQPAPPITFGLKAAGWLAAVRRSWSRLDAAFRDAMMLQFGGASGTLAALGDKGIPVAEALARELGLSLPDAPWHAQRDRLAALICACGVYVGTLGKIARDVSLLMQSEVAEAAEPGGDGRGGSSTMPQKRNPTASALALAAADRVPGLVASFLFGMSQEHERAVGGWHAEASTISRVMQDAGLASASVMEIAEGLTIDPKRMRANVEATRGFVYAERAMILLGEHIGRDAAHKLIEQAVAKAVASSRRLQEVLAETPEVMKVLSAEQIRGLDDPAAYLGSAELFRKRLLGTEK